VGVADAFLVKHDPFGKPASTLDQPGAGFFEIML
jgi:hypothetical protein